MRHDDNVTIIGVTGGVGSGKSAVMDILEKDFGARIILADLVSHELMEPGMTGYNAVVAAFGPGILCSGQENKREIDRQKLGEIVFSDPEKLEILNRIAHGGVAEEIRHRISTFISQRPSQETELIIAVEAALLIGSELEPELDSLWYIYADKEERIKRLRDSRGYSREYAESILSRQMSDRDFRDRCDVVIDNSGDLSDTRKQIDEILNKKGGRV